MTKTATKTATRIPGWALGACALFLAQGVSAQQGDYSVAPGALGPALGTLGRQAQVTVVAPAALVRGLSTGGSAGAPSLEAALEMLLSGTGLRWERTPSGAYSVRSIAADGPEGAVALDTIYLQGLAAPDVVAGYHPQVTGSATRTNTPLRDVPQTVDVVGREEITDRQVQSLTQALETVANVQLNSTAGNRGDTFLLRGFQSSAYAIDGTTLNPAGDRPEVFLDFAGVERVEVLKGPAAVLYGQGEPGGVINVVTRRPEAEPGGSLSFEGGSFDFGRIEGTATGKLDAEGRVRGRISGALTTDGGFQEERPTSQRQYLSGVVDWDLTEATTLSLGLDYTRQEVPFDRGLIVGADNEVLDDHDLWLGEDWALVESEKTRVTLGAEHVATDWLTLRGNLAYDSALTKDRGIDLRGLEDDGRTLNRRYTDRTEDQQNLDLRLEALADLQTGAVSHKLLAGVQYGWAEMDFENARANIDPIDIYDPVYGAARPEAEPRSAYVETIRRRSVYLQDQMELSAQWKLLAGLRFDDYDIERDVSLGSDVEPQSDSAWTGRLGVVYQPVETLSLYASWAQSFAPQSGVDRAGDPLAAEEGEQYEVGVKYEPLPGRLSTTLSAFQITKGNVATSDPDAPDADWSVVTGEQRVRGVEIEATGSLGAGVKLHGSAGWLEAEVTRDEDIEEGNRLPGVPEFNASLWGTYSPEAGSLRDWTFGAGAVHVGAREGDLENSYDVDGYTRFDAMATWRPSERVALQVSVRNLTDESYILSPSSRTENYAGAPRTVLAKLSYSF